MRGESFALQVHWRHEMLMELRHVISLVAVSTFYNTGDSREDPLRYAMCQYDLRAKRGIIDAIRTNQRIMHAGFSERV